MITVYIKKIENINENEKQNIINSLSTPANERLSKKRNESLHLASLCALSLLNNTQRANLNYTESGIPFFENINQNISISHSDMFASVAVSDSNDENVGIDIEDNSNIRISPRFLTENEQKIATDSQKFIEIWTKKESLFKFLKNDSLQFIHLDSTTPEKHGVSFSTVQTNEYVITICKEKSSKIEIIQK